MSLEQDIFAALSPLVGSRVSPVEFPQPPNPPPTWPAIRYTFISSVPFHDVCGDGDDETAETHIQIDVVAETFKAARLLRSQVWTALKAALPVRLDNTYSLVDSETKTYREIMEFSLHESTAS